MPSYVPNRASQGALVGALRSYAPNRFAGGDSSRVTSMAPHLSVAAADRPRADDISLLMGSQYAPQVPSATSFDRMWRYSPNTYEGRVSEMLRSSGVESALPALRIERQYADQPVVRDDLGNIVMTLDEQGNLAPKMLPPPPDPAAGDE